MSTARPETDRVAGDGAAGTDTQLDRVTLPIVASSPDPGLSAEEAGRRLAADGPNELPAARSRTLLQQAGDVLREPMLALLVCAGTVNFVLAEPLDGAILMSFVVVVIAISIFQQHKTESALTALRDLSAPRALVVRDGVARRVPGRNVVRGDLVVVSEGDRVPADAVLRDGVNLSVDESALTGESVPVRKAVAAPTSTGTTGRPGGDGTPWLFSGTLVVRGRGLATVTETGAQTELGRIGTALRTIPTPRTPLQREIDRLVAIVAVISVAASAVIVVVYRLTRGRWLEGVLAGIATAMSILPEEFPVILVVFVALGAWRMSQRHVLARRPSVIETLGSASVVCVDKTGTLTANTMVVRELVVDGTEHVVGGTPLPEPFHELVEFGVLASALDPFDPMDRAFRELGTTRLAGTEHLHERWELVREYPLSGTLLALCHVWRARDLPDYVVAAKGAPEAIADLCHLGPAERSRLTEQVERATAGGRRVLAVAAARFDTAAGLPTEPHEFAFRYLGFAALEDPVRPDAATAVADCQRAGIRVAMITGDYPGTAVAIAREVGLAHPDDTLTGADVEVMDDEELAARVRTVNVFARMVPDQKLRLVRAFQANGEIVAMTGDGVNDAPALRAADIGIAMGGRGTDVAREAAALVITDDDFASIAGGVRQGRGIFDNLRKAMAYTVAVHVPILGMSLVPLFVPAWPLVLLPVQIALLELIIDPACSVVFESEQIDPDVMAQPPRPPGRHLFDRRRLVMAVLQGVSVLATVVGVYLWTVLGDQPSGTVRASTFATLVTGNLALILVNRSWRLSARQSFRQRSNPALKWILASATTALVLLMTVPPLRDAFGFGVMSPLQWAVAALAGVAGVAWFEIYKLWTHR